MTLFAAWSEVVADWTPRFPQPRTARRAVRQALGALVCVGRRCLSRIIWTQGRQHRSWSSEYFLHSRCRWEPQSLFAGIWRRALPYCPGRLVGVAVDDTRLRKTGRAIPQARYHRDPLSPPFHVNLMWGLRFLQASLLLPLHRRGNASCRALPVRFEEAAPLKKPSRKAGAEAWQEYKKLSRLHNLSQRFVQIVAPLRQALDQAGGTAKLLVLALDGSFCNRTCLRAPRERTELIARTRKDARLCFRATPPSRRFYAPVPFTPEQVRQDPSHPWKQTKLFYGGKRRRIRYKEVSQLYWRRGGGQIPLRLFVVAPTPYRKRKSSRLYYRQPAYLLSTDLKHSAPQLLQIYFDRWQIEVNHRDEKDTLGVGQAQLWNINAVPKQPALVVAAYSALLLAALQAFGTQRTQAYQPLPRWRRKAPRPSCLDLVTLLRQEMVDHPENPQSLGFQFSHRALTQAADA
jgi:DDE superfamily endonuclease